MNVRISEASLEETTDPRGDIDVVVDLARKTGLFALASLEDEFREIIGVPVDVTVEDELRPKVKAEVERDAVTL